VLPLLVRRGLRVGYLKHAHAGFEIDQPGKDSYRMRRTGVLQTVLVGGAQVAVIDDAETDPGLEHTIARYVRSDLDVLVVEGFKRSPLPKIEIARAALSRELLCVDDADLLAVVSDFEPPAGIRHHSLGDASGIAELIASLVA